MGLKVFLDLESPSHRKRIEYVLRNFSLVYKVEMTFVNSIDEVGEDDLLIFYGENFDKRDNTIFIGRSDPAIDLFERRKAYEEIYDLATIHYVKLSPPFVPEEVGEFNLPVFFRVGEPIFEFEDGFRINFDILSCAFYFLSSWDERVKNDKDELGRFPDGENLLVKLGLEKFPVVNFYFHILRTLIQKSGFEISQSRWDGKDFALCLTHDVDVLKKWSAFGVYNEVVNKFIMGKEDIQGRRQRFARFIYLFSKGVDPYREGMKKIFEFERSFGVRSTFFLKSSFGRSKYDAKYKWDEFLVNFAGELKNSGFEIGLHPCFDSFDKVELMKMEKDEIEKIIGSGLDGVRQHYLRYDFRITPFIQSELGFKYDSTLGFAQRPGFRCGYAFPFKIYDVDGETELGLWEIPLVFMDAVYQYGRGGKEIDEIFDEVLKIVDVVKGFGGVAVVLFHNSVYDEFDFKGWDRVYEGLVKFALERGAFVGSCAEVLNLFTGQIKRS